MDLRLLEVFVRKQDRPEVVQHLEACDSLGVWDLGVRRDDAIVRALFETKDTQAAIDRLEFHFKKSDGKFHLILLPVKAAVPEPVAGPARIGRWRRRNRVSREELLESIDDSADLSASYVVLVAISSIVAAIGLLKNDPTVVIGAMVIAPLLGPNIALGLATCLGNLRLAVRSLRIQAIGISIALALAVALGRALPFSGFPSGADLPAVDQVAARTTVDVTSIALAFVAGTAGALGFATGMSSVLIGVMVAIALMPPLVAMGLLLGAGHPAEAAGSLLLLVANMTCLNLSAIATFLFHGIVPSRTRWRKRRRAARVANAALVVWIALLIVVLWLVLR